MYHLLLKKVYDLGKRTLDKIHSNKFPSVNSLCMLKSYTLLKAPQWISFGLTNNIFLNKFFINFQFFFDVKTVRDLFIEFIITVMLYLYILPKMGPNEIGSLVIFKLKTCIQLFIFRYRGPRRKRKIISVSKVHNNTIIEGLFLSKQPFKCFMWILKLQYKTRVCKNISIFVSDIP